MQSLLAFDIGDEQGKVLVGKLQNKVLRINKIHKFSTGQLSLNGRSYWDIYKIYEEMITSLKKCVEEHEVVPESVAVNIWGVDFGLVAEDNSLLRLPYTYRDGRTEASMPAFLERMGRQELYDITGIAIQRFNTLFQLYGMVMANDPVLRISKHLLFLPDLLNYFLSGTMSTEFTYATTSQLYNPVKQSWDEDIFRKLGLPSSMMQEVVQPGTVIGELNENISSGIHVEGIKVISVASHDTASGIVSVPAEGDDWAYICSNTWSLMGIENDSTIIDQRSLLFNFTNEGGAGHTYRYLKNIMGLWLLHQCRKSWAKSSGLISYAEIEKLAEMAEPFSAMLDPDYLGFYNPLDMPAAISTFCRQNGQVPPTGIGPTARTILEGLALKYRLVLDQLEMVTMKKINVIHIIGDGARNKLLCQFTANATGRKVVAGPKEAVGVGNLLVQAMGLGYLKDLSEIREVVRNSFELSEFYPENTEKWEQVYQGFLKIAKQN